ncbi:MAG: tRNA (guanosine(46)-N7)-methyltransferase TrmB [Tannerellaceae bacterium]|jgi:tRNA (guanine-N7-)-methyltransferase|nr:tRNA (guanosine(46)-N7)-methyltransferase TrmB [Tannerellaceae bacterium]
MGKNKQAKFEMMATYPHVFQASFDIRKEDGFALKGHWRDGFFRNTHPLVLELGCGKGEYTIGLGRRRPDANFIGVDIKGARMWSGAKESLEAGMRNVAFLRTRIEFLPAFFAPGEVSELWLTFPDPQMKKRNKRLTSTAFLRLYQQTLAPGGKIHLKTDSHFLYTYTLALARVNRFPVPLCCDDLYQSHPHSEILSIRTAYEQQWIERGIAIKYLCFVYEERETLVEPDMEIEWDNYRSFNRSKRSAQTSGK